MKHMTQIPERLLIHKVIGVNPKVNNEQYGDSQELDYSNGIRFRISCRIQDVLWHANTAETKIFCNPNPRINIYTAFIINNKLCKQVSTFSIKSNLEGENHYEIMVSNISNVTR